MGFAAANNLNKSSGFSPSMRKADSKALKAKEKELKKQQKFVSKQNHSATFFTKNGDKTHNNRQHKYHNHRKNSQSANFNSKTSEKRESFFANKSFFDVIATTPLSIKITIITALFILVAGLILYSPVQTYYKTYRNVQYREAVKAAYDERNAIVSADNAKLKTPEGIQDQARRELNYVTKGEISVGITNLDSTGMEYSGVPDQVDESAIKAPQSWYYNILDTIFLVNT